jgi:uncharacterized protein (UPF0335 family)
MISQLQCISAYISKIERLEREIGQQTFGAKQILAHCTDPKNAKNIYDTLVSNIASMMDDDMVSTALSKSDS